ncbi:HlyD family type I secretion periplasmic adaptor subunit [Tsuneonella mangrovi]|uniref:HlyD family type I secretion periplasmic adaptor subunit n=1 Tax=Tsuneonella mangrovi TaxID=1982042 RepID=UPI000BA1F5FB|nr:HlyD family type I secretion periplasmic adaptor subunit [Tsuneonella mangrovi]
MNLRETYAGWDASRRLIAIATVGLFLIVVWGSFAQVDQVTRGMGKVIPTSKAQLIQPAAPAVVSEILVRNGESVKKGQLLVKLDDSQAASELGQLQTENERLSVRAQRLGQEADGGTLGCAGDPDCSEERQLQEVRMATARSKQAALAAAVDQRKRDLTEAQATVSSLQNSVKLAQKQVDMLTPLAKQGIVPQTDLLSAQRDLVDTQGRLAAAQQGSARASAAIREAQAQLDSARLDFRQQALDERSQIQTKIAVNEESIRGAEARKQRNELRAPVNGIVNDLQITTIGGYVNAGEKIMQIVPVGDRLLVEARVDPKDIAFIKVGDPANVKVTAYDFSIFGGLTGKVQQISADSIFDETERKAYYSVVVETDKSYLVQDGKKLPIVPGMICDVEIVTGHRSIMAYLLMPVERAFGTALTER